MLIKKSTSFFTILGVIFIISSIYLNEVSSTNSFIINSNIENSVALKQNQEYDVSIPRVDASNVVIDGLISDNEYIEYYFEPTTEMKVYWEHNSVNLSVGIVSKGIGWVSLGIGDQMEDSNMIMGGIMGGFTYALDLVGTGGYTPGHGNDTLNGGNYDILEAKATENATNTIFEFIIPMNSTDPLDPVLEENSTYSMFFGFNDDSDSFFQYHTGHSATITVFIRPYVPIFETSLFFEIESQINQGEVLTLNATLINESSTPLVDFEIEFFLSTQFGLLIFDIKKTDDLGEATTSYQHPTLSGNLSFGARFNERIINEDGKLVVYKASQIQHTLQIVPVTPTEADPIRLFIGFIGFTFASVALIIVWGFYGFNVITIISFLIRKPSPKRPGKDTLT